ncbi:DUF1573 domain-containing protein [Flavobacterium sp. SUN052]|uniref:DUF1573 domain-containing protein n=1 Tax=Flavobacterium sp. SUN052 TaxID=3002441 RepID=UPI00237D7536|nr:DUF1573 domain-containing protein [Flavobacterium sp. SUN052]MEC4005683.1 DUF1573 domain-containing protein [Flavobacterium sp. SUN052]
MKKILFVAFVMINCAAFAQSGAKIVFKDKDNTIDYGTVSKDTDSGLRKFEFTNTGDAPLVISNAKSTCGCTVADYPKTPIMPGKTGVIEVKYNMNPGPIRKTITIESNAVNVDGGMVALKIKGEVIVKKEVNPLEKKQSLLEKS